jgi:glutamate dehydrogenase (NAD(P)+)
LTNSGGVIYAAHEKLVPTPRALQFPDRIRGDEHACERWLADHADAFAQLAADRRALAQRKRNRVIERNMAQLVQGLVSDRTALSCDVAEHVAKSRIETQRTIDRLMTDEFVAVSSTEDIQTVASKMKALSSEAALVLSPRGALVGIITDWDIVLAVANRMDAGRRASEIMTEQVVAFQPHENVIDVMPLARKRGYSVMPVIDGDRGVLGVIRLQDLIEI